MPPKKRGQTSLEDKLAAIHQSVRNEALRSANTDDPVIYHYTSPNGLIGILKNGRVWATNIRHFEDKAELLYAETFHEQVLDAITQQHKPNSLQSRLAEACRIDPVSAIPRRAGPLSRGSGRLATWLNKVLDIYVACFSTRNDLQSQWKKYACGGSGVAIGFKRSELMKAIQPPRRRGGFPTFVYLAKVRYNPEEQRRELRSSFDRYCSVIYETSPHSDLTRCAKAIVNELALHASLFKHPDFEPEKEWRIIIEALGGGSDLLFRSSADMVIPYMETAELPVDSITIGPAMDQDPSERGVRALLDTKGYRRVRISRIGLKLL